MEQLELTALQKAKKNYYEKIKNDPTYIQHRRANCTKYYNKIKNETEFKEKVSNYKRQYYIQKKEQLLEIIV
jgi:hypothetical protein